MKKAAIELSANFIVVMILSAALMVGGFFLVKNLFISATGIQEDLDMKTMNEMERLISSGARVAIPFSAQDVKPGKVNFFGLGILNELPANNDSGDSDTFNVSVVFSDAFNGNNPVPLEEISPDSWIIYSKSQFAIKKKEQYSVPIGIKVTKGTPSGSYIFNVEVKYKNTATTPSVWKEYDKKKKITVNV
jgi:hypothetical protein